MQMLTKFESKSSRAKGVAFHSKRPWILVSLHSSTIQLWDYRMGTLIDRFEGHDGPVRGVDFHKTQPLFVSCADDYSIKVWSLQTRKCLFTLTGHLDYVRTVFFHEDLPWIISASDDQTIRIWNWQNRQEIACLTGHNHYVMCAQFHPKEDLIVSASLDQTVRVWDISGLRKKHSAPSQSVHSFEDQLSRANVPQQDIFGNTDAIVKFVLEGHDRGVNWASFHPSLPLIVSGGDDRLLKVWRMSETKAWEVDTCRGHLNNVMCCLFHPFQDIIISVSEDKSIRTWDLNRRTPIHQFKRDSEKFWYIAAHRSINLFAAAHDGGVMVFKLERERPANIIYQNTLFYVNKDKQLKAYEIGGTGSSSDLALLSLKKIGGPWAPFINLSYNPAERALLVTTRGEQGKIYELVTLPKDAGGAIEPTDTIRGSADQALFISRNRFAVLAKTSQNIEIRDLSNSITKTVKAPILTKDILYGGPGLLLLLGQTSVVLFDIQQKKTIATLNVGGVKYASWSNDGQYVALLGKHMITIANKSLGTVASIHETLRIKSAVWDDNGILIYTTLNHLKYSLINGDHGTLKTLENTVYVVKVKGKNIYSLARGGSVEVITIDPTEYRFKKALLDKNFSEVFRLIKTSQLVGQSIISYLQKKGYAEIALQFVGDPQAKFDLAIECGNLEVAVEQAKVLSTPSIWSRLGQEALLQGNHEIAELVYQKQHNFDKLSFLYLITGNTDNLQKMSTIAEKRGDTSARFQSSIYLGDVESRIQLLKEANLYPLAYSLAKSNGLDDEAKQILEESELTEDQITVDIHPVDDSKPAVTRIANETYKSNWPLKAASLSFFEKAILGQIENLSVEDTPVDEDIEKNNNIVDEFSPANNFDDFEDAQDDAGGWDLDVEDLGIDDVDANDVAVGNGATGSNDGAYSVSGIAESDLWIRNSPLAADHVAGGSFETASQMLNRQLGVANFAPLKKRFLEVYRSSKLYLTATDGLEPLKFYVRRTLDDNDPRRALPLVPGYETLGSKLQEAYKAVRSNKLEVAIELFRELLYTIVVLSVPSKEEADECKKLIEICREYILAFSIELARRALPETDVKRNLELAAYFTQPKLQSAHASIPLQVAMKQAFSHKNFASASTFAARYLKLVPSGPSAEVARKLKARADANPLDHVDIDYDQHAEFDICPSTLTPIYAGIATERDPLTGAKYHVTEKGKLCNITNITVVGAPASGLRLYV